MPAKERKNSHKSKKDKSDRKERREAREKKREKLGDLLGGGDTAVVKPKSKKSKHDKVRLQFEFFRNSKAQIYSTALNGRYVRAVFSSQEAKGDGSERKKGQSKSKKLGYEEAPGIATPSHERGTSIPQTPMSPSLALLQCESKFEPLKEDSNIRLVSLLEANYDIGGWRFSDFTVY